MIKSLGFVSAFALLTACAGPADRAVLLDGAETLGPEQAPRVATAVFTREGNGQRMELVSTDGAVFSGLMTEEVRPTLVPLAAAGGAPIPGETELVGTIGAGGQTMDCRFRLLNPVRGMDGGGSGRCDGAEGRSVEFRF
jgi:hypothetical protein